MRAAHPHRPFVLAVSLIAASCAGPEADDAIGAKNLEGVGWVVSFTLINADNDQPIAGFDPIPEGATLNLATLPTPRLNVRANTSPATVGSVKFGLDGNAEHRIETTPPYALQGDVFPDYWAWTPSVSPHQVTATPYSGGGGSGTPGTGLTLNFTVTNTAPPSMPARIAISSDGNDHDCDDYTATPFSIAILAKTGNASRLVYYGHSDHIWSTGTDGLCAGGNREAEMHISTVDTANLWGGFAPGIFFNAKAQLSSATAALAAQINASSSTNPLWIVGAGPMDVIGRALTQSDPAKRQYVTVLTHSEWNNDHAPLHGSQWSFQALGTTGVNLHTIQDQNAGLRVDPSRYTWTRDSSDPKINWLWQRHLASGLGSEPAFDPSDAGMIYWLVTGGVNGGDASATPEKLKTLFGVVDPPAGSQAVVSFTLIDAGSNQPIATHDPIPPGATLNIATLPTRNLNIRANTNPAQVGSVRFGLNGNANHATETAFPYALFGDNGGDYNPWTPTPGPYTVTGTPYTLGGGGGTAGTALQLSFTVIDQAGAQNQAPTVNAGPDRSVTFPSGVAIDATVSDDGLPSNTLAASWTKVSGPSTVTFSSGTSVDTTATFGAAGSYTLRLTASDGALSASDDVNVTVTSAPQGQSVVSFTLIDAGSNQPIAAFDPIPPNATLNLATLPTRSLNIRANTNPTQVGSVRFGLGGNANHSTETAFPYALFGDNGGDYNAWTPAPSTYTVTGTPYTEASAGGTPGTALQLSFTVIDQPPPGGGGMVFPGASWATQTPEQQGMDSADLNAAFAYLGTHMATNETLVIRNGYVIRSSAGVNNRHQVWSTTKSFTSTVLGLLIDEGRVTLDTPARNFDANLTSLYPNVTMRHFATMTSGYDAPGASYDQIDGSENPYVPGTPVFVPGTQFLYFDDAMNEFGKVLHAVAGQDVRTYFQTKIAGPVGMSMFDWGTVLGHPWRGTSGNWEAGVQLTALDAARFGHLFLNRGRWAGTQLISEAWVTAATTNQVPHSLGVNPLRGDGRGIYGFNWWCNGFKVDGQRRFPAAPAGLFFTAGKYANMIFVIPEWNMVIVRLQDGGTESPSDAVWNTFFSMIGQSFL